MGNYLDLRNGEGWREVFERKISELGHSFNQSVEDFINEKNDDCIFDLKTQNKDFLSGINAFNDLIWHDSTKTAIGLFEEDTLKIHRGGCDHFDFTVTIYSSDSTSIDNQDYWFKKFRIVTSLLGKQFENKLVDSLCYNKHYELIESNLQYRFFLDQELYCSMEFE